jgi:hypothetical protein
MQILRAYVFALSAIAGIPIQLYATVLAHCHALVFAYARTLDTLLISPTPLEAAAAMVDIVQHVEATVAA